MFCFCILNILKKLKMCIEFTSLYQIDKIKTIFYSILKINITVLYLHILYYKFISAHKSGNNNLINTKLVC